MADTYRSPAPGVQELDRPPLPVNRNALTQRAFWRRFTAAEREALQGLLATGTQAQKNKLAAFRDYVATGLRVELDDDYIVTVLGAMEAFGLLGAGRAAQILGAPIGDAEA